MFRFCDYITEQWALASNERFEPAQSLNSTRRIRRLTHVAGMRWFTIRQHRDRMWIYDALQPKECIWVKRNRRKQKLRKKASPGLWILPADISLTDTHRGSWDPAEICEDAVCHFQSSYPRGKTGCAGRGTEKYVVSSGDRKHGYHGPSPQDKVLRRADR